MAAELRDFIIEHFSREELLTFCVDYFRDFYEEYEGVNTIKSALARDLIEHCRRREQVDNLRVALQQARPTPYESAFVRIATAPVKAKPRDPRQVFLSHAHEDAAFAQRLLGDLRAEGLQVWMAPDSIQPGENWVRAIGRGLTESGIYVVALTPQSVQSHYVQQETEYALQQHNSGRGRLVPLLVKPCEKDSLSPLISTLQHVDFERDYAAGLTSLFRSLGIDTAAQPSIDQPNQHAFTLLSSPVQIQDGATAPNSPSTVYICVDEHVLSTGDTIRLGEVLTVTFTLANNGIEVGKISTLVIGSRGPGGRCNQDHGRKWNAPDVPFPTMTNISLRPGEMVTYTGSRALHLPGTYFLEPTLQDAAGQWHGILPFSCFDLIVE